MNILNNLPIVSNPIGSITRMDNISFTETVDLTNVFTETDPNQFLTYQIMSSPSFTSCTLSATNILTVVGNATAADIIGNPHRVQVTADDSYDVTLEIMNINIIENRPPSAFPFFTSAFTSFEGVTDSIVFFIFSDDELNPIVYSIVNDDGSSLNTSWINFDALTRNLSFTPTADLVSPVLLKMIASDPFNDPVEEPIVMTVKFKPKDNAAIIFRTGEFICQSASSFEISKNILIDEDIIISYRIELTDGSPAPTWLEILYLNESISGNFEFSGTYPLLEYNLYNFTIFGTDTDGLVGNANFYIETKRKSSFLILLLTSLSALPYELPELKWTNHQ